MRNLDKQQIETPVRKFKNFIEMNKDHQAYSDFKEGVNKGLDIAKYTFEENAEKFSLSYFSTSLIFISAQTRPFDTFI